MSGWVRGYDEEKEEEGIKRKKKARKKGRLGDEERKSRRVVFMKAYQLPYVMVLLHLFLSC